MENKQYIEIFNRKFENGLDIDGIKLKLIGINNPDGENHLVNEQLVFLMSNKNDLSYNKIALQGLIQEKLHKFNRLFGLGSFGFDNIKIENAEDIYIGEGDNVRELMSELFTKTNRLISYTYHSQEHNYSVYDLYFVEHLSFTYEMEGDFISFTNNVNVQSAFVINDSDGKIIEELDIDDAENMYHEGFSGKYGETELNYNAIDYLDLPTRFLDDEYQAMYVDTNFE